MFTDLVQRAVAPRHELVKAASFTLAATTVRKLVACLFKGSDDATLV